MYRACEYRWRRGNSPSDTDMGTHLIRNTDKYISIAHAMLPLLIFFHLLLLFLSVINQSCAEKAAIVRCRHGNMPRGGEVLPRNATRAAE